MQPERAAELVAVWTAEAIAQHIAATGKAIEDAVAPLVERLAEAEARAAAAEVRAAETDDDLSVTAKSIIARIEREAEAAETRALALAARLAELEAVEPIPGPKGADGVDRPIIDMVTSWGDDTETLPRGVLLADDAGLFMATREAHGPPSVEPSSWRCLAAGLRLEASDYEGDRRLVWQARAGHELVELPIALPVPIHRGLWDADADYAKHDLCTWDGAVWRALGELPAGAPPPDDPASDWGIYSPRGKTGRPGKDGGRGLPGERGRGIAQVLGTIVDGHLLIELDDGEIARVDLTPLVETITDALKGEAQ